MLKNQISPKVTAIATTLIMAAITAAYWLLLVYQPPLKPGGGGGGGGGPALQIALGRQDVQVESLTDAGPGYRDGPPWSAQFCGPSAVAVEAGGSVLVADSRNHRIRRVSPAGQVSTVAGSGPAGGSGGQSNGPALQARFRFPAGLAVGPDRTIYVSDSGNNRLCQIRQGVVSTLAGGPAGKADGEGAAARFRYPGTLMLYGPDLWVADVGNRAVRRVTPAGSVTTPTDVPQPVKEALGELDAPRGGPLQASADGQYEAEETQFKVGRRSPGVGPAGAPHVFADTQNHVVLARLSSGRDFLIAGRLQEKTVVSGSEDGPGNRASFELPCAVAVAPGGLAYVADYEANQVRRLRLPAWLTGSTMPTAERPRRWRPYRGR